MVISYGPQAIVIMSTSLNQQSNHAIKIEVNNKYHDALEYALEYWKSPKMVASSCRFLF